MGSFELEARVSWQRSKVLLEDNRPCPACHTYQPVAGRHQDAADTAAVADACLRQRHMGSGQRCSPQPMRYGRWLRLRQGYHHQQSLRTSAVPQRTESRRPAQDSGGQHQHSPNLRSGLSPSDPAQTDSGTELGSPIDFVGRYIFIGNRG